MDGLGSVQEWECETGARFRQPSTIEDRATVWTAHFPPLATRVFVVSEWDSEDLPARPCFVSTGSIPAEGPFEYTLNEPNLCVLDYASYRLGDEPWRPEKEILQIDSAVRSERGLPQRAGDMVQPWAATKLGLHAAVGTTPLALRFEFEADTLPSAPIELVMETPERFEIRINGKLIEVPCEPEWIIDPCLKRIPLSPDAIRHGNNQIELATAFAPDVDLEAIYLAGAFGVSLRENRPVLGVLPKTLYCSDVTTQGLPFYSGTISYRIPLPAPAEPETVLRIETGAFGGALVKVRFDESTDATAIAWPPYHADLAWPADARALVCDVLLTRINTFGPLHLNPKKQNGIGPFSFRTEGEHFSRACQLWQGGLLNPPTLKSGRWANPLNSLQSNPSAELSRSKCSC